MRSRSGAELPQLELDCLVVLWSAASTPATLVQARLAERGRPLAYTTVLTVLERLVRKQVVTRHRHGRAYLYAALVSREQMRERALDRLVGNYFASRHELRGYLDAAPPALPPSPVPSPALTFPPAILAAATSLAPLSPQAVHPEPMPMDPLFVESNVLD